LKIDQDLQKNSKIGKKVNKYQLKEELGSGGFGSVYYAKKGRFHMKDFFFFDLIFPSLV
jgi:hypothetical protein